jgi:L-lysine exporter family protein LysE/ArgO
LVIEAFLHGILLALGLILPLGAQNVFVFNQGATQPSLLRALPVVITASLCDTLLILLAVTGVSLVVLTFAWIKTILFAVGVCFLAYMGWVTWNSKSTIHGEARERFSAKKQILFATSVSLFNPHAILDTIGVIGTSSLSYTGMEKWGFTIACMLVSWVWFATLALAGRTAGKLDASGRIIRVLNRISGVIIWGVAVYMGVKLLLGI